MPKYYGPKIPIEIDSDSNITSPKDLLASPIPVFYRDPSDSTLQTTQLYKTVRGGGRAQTPPALRPHLQVKPWLCLGRTQTEDL